MNRLRYRKTDKIPRTDNEYFTGNNWAGCYFWCDKNIPVCLDKKPYLFALIIGNEDYSSFQQNGLGSEVNVAYAANDARIFKEYAAKTLEYLKKIQFYF